jgi:hypothetical protein
VKSAIRSWQVAPVSVVILGFVLLFSCAVSWAADPKVCGQNGQETLNPFGNVKNNFMTDLKVVGICDINGKPTQDDTSLLYVFHNVNIVNGGKLIFHDDFDVDFYAESILVENGGTLTAVSTNVGFLPRARKAASALPFQKRLTFHLWGAPEESGITCLSDPQPLGAPCGIPDPVWSANTIMADDLMMNPPPAPPHPKNNGCKSVSGYSQFLPGDDCFYQYEIQDKQDKANGTKAYFGHKVLAVSFGGTLQLFGARGVTYLQNGQQCTPNVPNTECNPAFTGTSWVRLAGSTGATHITLSRAVDWKKGDHIVVTPTDYLPSHAEEVILAKDASETGGNVLELEEPGLKYDHRATTFSLGPMPAKVGPQNDPNVPDIDRAVDTRAAVGLLTRNIQVVSQGNRPSDTFTAVPGNYFGGHTMVRQGFASYQVQGVMFYQLGQGGALGRYPVHFHMDRKTPQPTADADDPTPEPLNYVKDCSIWDSMTRWVTIHATEGMYLARNVGFESIGHGYYLEDATEIDNKLYGNLGVLARAAIRDKTHNPRQVPGILADNRPRDPGIHNNDYFPYRSDYNHPSVFWITNGWNDFEYNFAAGAATCGACYWWLPASDSGLSQYQNWDGYASQQIAQNSPTNYNRAGMTPLKSFVGNSCVAAMSSFQMNGQTAECLGVSGDGNRDLSAVPSSAPPGPSAANFPAQPFGIYYPVVGEVHNPTLCKAEDGNCAVNVSPCDGADTFSTCTVTHIDRYTTSFNFAQTNFAAVWLRKGWNLVTNSAFTDVQSGGLNFITGGGYTRSDVSLGEWMLARNSVFIGHTQQPDENSFALDVGPFNSLSGLSCDSTGGSAKDHCEYADGGVSFNLPPFPGQKLLNIYDGPSQQDMNGYININAAKIDDCSASPGGTCWKSKVPLAWNFGVLHNQDTSECYIPNAAIGWKQPNGFYYPPAFHSRDLYFDNVDIRHFVVEPLFEPLKPGENDPFKQDQSKVDDRYCTHSSDMFSASFNNIDRQTVLNDDDGTLTGLVGKQGGEEYESISINEDSFFNAPLTTPECLSDINVKPKSPPDVVATARTSPYEWISTAIIADCAIVQNVGIQQCFDTKDQRMKWSIPCTNTGCRGVPLYREYLISGESKANPPQIRMMGQATAQRSTLSLNNGAYYIDTTQNCTSQGACPKCIEFDPDNSQKCVKYEGSPWSPSVFLGGHTYYVYFLYAKSSMKQTYDIYVGPNTNDAELDVKPVRLDPNNYSIKDSDGNFASGTYANNILKVTVDLSGQQGAFSASKKLFCRPQSYCKANDNGSCVCQPGSDCKQDSDCAWGPTDMDCPVDPANPNGMQCFGFRFTMPARFEAPPVPMPPPQDLFVDFTTNPYFQKGNVTFAQGKATDSADVCTYNPVPMQP